MTLGGAPEELIKELPSNLRLAGRAVLAAVSITAAYFLFVSGPITMAQTASARSEKRIDKVEGDISSIRGDLSDIRAQSERRDQKVDDIKESIAVLDKKLDRLLAGSRSQRAAIYP